MKLRSVVFVGGVLAACVTSVAPSFAGGFGDTSFPGYSPSIPISALARPMSWLDPSRMQLSTSVSVGSAFGTTQALQVTSLRYQFGAPLSMAVSVGNSFGPSSAGKSGSPFLEGLSLAYRPARSLFINVQYRDLRSPLQYQDAAFPYGAYSDYERR
jgi:hypothetical protein